MVLVVLAIIWAIALLPPLIRSRMEASPADSIGRFNRHLSVLRSTSPAASALAGSAYGPMPRVWVEEARRLGLQRRRLQVVKSMLIVSGLTLLVGLLPEMRLLLVAHLLVDVALAAYVVKLAKARKLERQRREHRSAAEADVVVPEGTEAPSAPGSAAL